MLFISPRRINLPKGSNDIPRLNTSLTLNTSGAKTEMPLSTGTLISTAPTVSPEKSRGFGNKSFKTSSSSPQKTPVVVGQVSSELETVATMQSSMKPSTSTETTALDNKHKIIAMGQHRFTSEIFPVSKAAASSDLQKLKVVLKPQVSIIPVTTSISHTSFDKIEPEINIFPRKKTLPGLIPIRPNLNPRKEYYSYSREQQNSSMRRILPLPEYQGVVSVRPMAFLQSSNQDFLPAKIAIPPAQGCGPRLLPKPTVFTFSLPYRQEIQSSLSSTQLNTGIPAKCIANDFISNSAPYTSGVISIPISNIELSMQEINRASSDKFLNGNSTISNSSVMSVSSTSSEVSGLKFLSIAPSSSRSSNLLTSAAPIATRPSTYVVNTFASFQPNLTKNSTFIPTAHPPEIFANNTPSNSTHPEYRSLDSTFRVQHQPQAVTQHTADQLKCIPAGPSFMAASAYHHGTTLASIFQLHPRVSISNQSQANSAQQVLLSTAPDTIQSRSSVCPPIPLPPVSDSTRMAVDPTREFLSKICRVSKKTNINKETQKTSNATHLYKNEKSLR